MAPYDDWNKVDEDDEDELQDSSFFEAKRDIVVFCIDCSESMQQVYSDAKDESGKTPRNISHVFAALEAAMEVQKRKVIVGPNDSVGIMLFNTTRKNARKSTETEYKSGTFVFQPIEQINAEKIKSLMLLLGDALKDTQTLSLEFPPLPDNKHIPMGDVFTSCNWLFRDGAPKTGLKRVFLITDEDDPHPGANNKQLVTSAGTTLDDLTQSGILVEPFFISTSEKPFDVTKFYSSILQTPFNPSQDDDDLLPETYSLTRISDLLAQMRIREQPKRSIFRMGLELGDGFVIGVRGYGLVTEQKKGPYKYFLAMESDAIAEALADGVSNLTIDSGFALVEPRTQLIDEAQQTATPRSQVLFGMSLGTAGDADIEKMSEDDIEKIGTREVKRRAKVFFTAEEIKNFRTLGLEPGIKLLGFKPSTELQEEDNVKHSTFIYPDETLYAGSRRTFLALLKSMHKKKKIGIVRAVMRSNAAPVICAMVPQIEKTDETGWLEPSGFHLIQYPFADDLRAAPVDTSLRAAPELVKAAKAIVDKLKIKDGSYPPDAHPNPVLGFHYAQLEATAFRQEYNPEEFEDLTEPNYDVIHRRVGPLLREWKQLIEKDESSRIVNVGAAGGVKRKADTSVDEAEIREKHHAGQLSKLRVDQLKDFLKSKSQPISGKKGELVERVSDWLYAH